MLRLAGKDLACLQGNDRQRCHTLADGRGSRGAFLRMTHSLLLCAAALLYAPPVRADDRTCEATPYAVLAVAELEAQCGGAGVGCWTSGVVELELNPIRKRSSTPTANEAALKAGAERHGVRLYDAAGQRRAKSVLQTSRRSSVASPAASAARKERSARPRAASAAPKTARFADDAPATHDAPASPAPTWTTHLDDQGTEYFYNTATGEARWTDPASPTEWVIHHTDDGVPYLYSTRTGETKWSEHAASPTAAPPGAERKEDDGAPDGGAAAPGADDGGGEAPAPAEQVEDGEAPVDGGGEAPPVEDAVLVDVPLEVAPDATP